MTDRENAVPNAIGALVQPYASAADAEAQEENRVPQYAPGLRDPSRDELAQDCLDLTLEHLDDEIMSEADCIVANALSVATSHLLFAPHPDETIEAWGRRIGAYDPEADEADPLSEAEAERLTQRLRARQLMDLLHCIEAMLTELGLDQYHLNLLLLHTDTVLRDRGLL